MLKITLIFKEMLYLIKKHKFYFLTPILLVLCLLAIFIYSAGPSAIVAFIYAGV